MAEFLVMAPKDAGVTAVSSLRRSLLEAMDKAGPDDSVVLDLGALASADSALAQLIIAFRLEAKLRKQKVVVKVEDSRLSVSALLGCDVLCEACAFNDFRAKLDSGSEGAMPAATSRAGEKSRTKEAKA